MGKTKLQTIGQVEEKKALSSEEEYKARQAKKAAASAKTGKAKKKVHLPGLKGGQRVKMVEAEPITEVQKVQEVPEVQKVKEKKTKTHGKKYLAARAKVDPTKAYSYPDVARLVKETSFSKFDGSVELHLVLAKDNLNQNVDLPHWPGRTKKIEIASEETIKKLQEGKIDFDVLLASPQMMPKLVPFAKLLGPRGLMPNPKNGTLTDDPRESAQKVSANQLSLKTQKEAPLVHTVVARTSQPEAEIEENIHAVVEAIGPKTIKKAVVKSTMGPAIRLAI